MLFAHPALPLTSGSLGRADAFQQAFTVTFYVFSNLFLELFFFFFEEGVCIIMIPYLIAKVKVFFIFLNITLDFFFLS